MLDFGVVNATDTDCKQQVPTAALRLQQFFVDNICGVTMVVLGR